MIENSKLLSVITGLMYPFIILTGFYIILNGHLTPGGGFQGGAMMASVFMSRYLVRPKASIDFDFLQLVEKLAFTFLIAFGLMFFLSGLQQTHHLLREPYMITMNILIGLKVSCGLIIVFFRFVFYESR